MAEVVITPELIDKKRALTFLGNNEELYKSVLKEYLKENLETPEKLRTAIDEKRHSDAAEMLHKLKSSTGSIGATEVYKRAVSLHNAIRENDEAKIASEKDEFIDILRQLIEQLKRGSAV